MPDLQATAEYLSTGANRHTAIADWSQSGVLAFGANSNICLWTPSASSHVGIEGILSGHKDAVKAVKFLPPTEGGNEVIISGSDDKTLKLWALNADRATGQCIQTLTDHTAPINTIAILKSRNPSTPTLIATGAADATFRVWKYEAGRLLLLSTIKPTPKFFPLTLALSTLDHEDDVVVLAVAGTKDIIQIYVAANTAATLDFQLQATLTGHEGWIRSLDFTWESSAAESDLLLASASQDKYVRLWRLHQGSELPAMTSNADPATSAFLPGKSPANKAHRLQSCDKVFSITFEALLLGHEDWIYSAKWFRSETEQGGGGGGGGTNRPLQLLSTSADNSLAIWEADPASGIWVSMVRLGDISREKGATTATGSIGGFWTGLWAPDGQSVVCLGRTGSWRRWVWDGARDEWKPRALDQRTHKGRDGNCVGQGRRVPGVDEQRPDDEAARALEGGARRDDAGVDDVADAADMPVLGLSNKAIDAADPPAHVEAEADVDVAPAVRTTALDIDHPPFEDSLSRHTLWPEVEKLYGHGYEISCLATSHDGKLVASACRASSLNHAVIRIFETDTWVEVRPPLAAHTLTATRLRFSRDDRYLLSVGRDRQWAVFEREGESAPRYQLLQANPKGHSRMILDAAWAPSASPAAFATAGRDKKVRVWSAKTDDDGKTAFVQAAEVACGEPVTAVDFLGRSLTDGALALAVGTESGKMSIHTLDAMSLQVVSSTPLPEHLCLPTTVLQLAWRPADDDSQEYQLAVAGEDSSTRIYRLPGLVSA
ncbi:elongator complex protein [Verticillium alfalfae VaMs.102]|uniref:Elongator complex protein 2 n=1 Tax=Verticillium alfalfae (strain VaMs.102 / ATCC MYA-4576 / FGSC 10136) TaxID=526221 RepID=C9S8Y0_VERA1|nr:elongator complex protein [Verticillium alfalfae VaMs.102]EEY14057.1 elongator complex protein [Verticillium alfalfae VaMs.102]